MKTQLRYLLFALALAAAVLLPPSSAPAQSGEDPAVVAMLAELTTQQATLQDNQTKMDTKIAAIAEDIRQARLFAARGGR